MSGLLPIFSSLAIAAIIFWLTLICFSFRDFSRSRLEEICKNHNKLGRFGSILQNHEKLLLLCELFLLLTLSIGLWVAFGSSWCQSLKIPQAAAWADFTIWLCRVLAVVVFGGLLFVLLPWTIARVRGESLLYRFWPILLVAGKVGEPVWQFAIRMDRMMHRVFGVPEPEGEQVANLLTEELLTVVDESRREGVIQSNASKMIRRVVDLQTEDVAAIMTPRTDMVTITADTRLDVALTEMLESGFSRVPVIREGIDDIVGILYARDLLAYVSETTGNGEGEDQRTVKDIARDALYAPESQGIGDLLEAMRQQKVHMAIIVDEYSGVSGLVTLEDILEEIVGEIADEHDVDMSGVKTEADGSVVVEGTVPIRDLNRALGWDLPDEEATTIAGLVIHEAQLIPAEKQAFTFYGKRFLVMKRDKNRIEKLRVKSL